MRADRRRGAGKKSTRILDLIEHYWDQIEGDLARHMGGVDARDWIRGDRPWAQFLVYCDDIAQHEGGRLWAAQLSDERFDAEIERMLAERGTTPQRPELEGDTAVVRAIRVMSNDIRQLTRLMTKARVSYLQGPMTPADRLAARKSAMSRARIAELLDDD